MNHKTCSDDVPNAAMHNATHSIFVKLCSFANYHVGQI